MRRYITLTPSLSTHFPYTR